MNTSNTVFGLLPTSGSRVQSRLHKDGKRKLKLYIPDTKYEDKVERIFAQTNFFFNSSCVCLPDPEALSVEYHTWRT